MTITWRLRYNDAELYACDKPKCQVVSNYSDFSLIRFTYIRTYFTTHKQNMCIYIKSKLKKSEIVKKPTYFHDFNQPNTFDFFSWNQNGIYSKSFRTYFLDYLCNINKIFSNFFREIKMELTQKVVRLIFTTYLLYIFFDIFFFSFQVFSTLYFILFFQFFTTFFFRSIQFCRIFRILLILSNFVKIKLVIFFLFRQMIYFVNYPRATKKCSIEWQPNWMQPIKAKQPRVIKAEEKMNQIQNHFHFLVISPDWCEAIRKWLAYFLPLKNTFHLCWY